MSLVIELVYQSFANSDLTYAELNNLMVTSTFNNNEYGITGCLLYHNRTFIQVLEGEQKEVSQLFEKIRKDKRHSKINLVWQAEIKERGFSGWSMSLMNLGSITFQEIFSEYLDSDKLDYDIDGIVTTSKSILRKFKDGI